MVISKKILVPAGSPIKDFVDKFKQEIEVLQKRIPALISVYCFGSSVQGYETLESDLDMAYLSEGQITNIKRWTIQEEIASLLRRDVDLIDLKTATDVMKFQIINKGVRIFVKDVRKAEQFEDLVYCLYLDLNEQRKGILEDIYKRGYVYG